MNLNNFCHNAVRTIFAQLPMLVFNLGYCYFGRTRCKPVATDVYIDFCFVMATFDYHDKIYVINEESDVVIL